MQDSDDLMNAIKPMPTPMQNEINLLRYHVEGLQKDVQRLEGQFNLYEPKRETALQLIAIQNSIHDVKEDAAALSRQMADLSKKLDEQEAAAQKREKERIEREAAERQRQDRQQIKVLIWVAVTAIGALVSIYIAYVTGFFH